MSRVEQGLGIFMGGAALSTLVGMVGNYHEREANSVGAYSFFKEILETDKQTKDRLEDVDSYQLWSDALYVTAVAIVFITAILVFAPRTTSKR
jgi:hypothetical protein